MASEIGWSTYFSLLMTNAGEQREPNLSISIQTSSSYPQMQEGDG